MNPRRVYGLHAKCLRDHLRPLQRLLASALGRRWDDVYSELRAGLRVDATLQLHVLQHIRSELRTDVIEDDLGQPLVPRHASEPPHPVYPSYTVYTRVSPLDGFYVDGAGTLRRAPPRPRIRRPRRRLERIIDGRS